MRKTPILMLFIIWTAFSASAQTTVVAWNFPNNPDNTIADGGTVSNSSQNIAVVGASGYTYPTGVTTRSISADTWDNGNGSKYWEVSFSTAGLYGITLSSKQQSSATGPANFKIQYKIGSGGTYADVTGGTVTVANNFTTGAVTSLSLPSATDNQSVVYVRWIMTSNNPVSSGSSVGSGGTSRIDDILVSSATALPLHLLSFDGMPKSNVLTLQWKSSCEASMKAYEVEKSADGAAFSTISSIAAKNSGCGTDATYSYNDAAFSGNAAYRLKMSEVSGVVSYSPVRYFRSGAAVASEISVSPNPASSEIHVKGLDANTTWRITDSYGRVISNGLATDDATSISIGNLPAGFYFLQSPGAQSARFVKQ